MVYKKSPVHQGILPPQSWPVLENKSCIYLANRLLFPFKEVLAFPNISINGFTCNHFNFQHFRFIYYLSNNSILALLSMFNSLTRLYDFLMQMILCAPSGFTQMSNVFDDVLGTHCFSTAWLTTDEYSLVCFMWTHAWVDTFSQLEDMWFCCITALVSFVHIMVL